VKRNEKLKAAPSVAHTRKQPTAGHLPQKKKGKIMHKLIWNKAITKTEFADSYIANLAEDETAHADFAATPCGLVTDRPQKVFGVMTVQHLIGNDLGRRLP
jgi:hypothetical protein